MGEFEQFCERIRQAQTALTHGFAQLATVIEPALVAINQLWTKAIVNRRARKALEREDWAALAWFVQDHCRRCGITPPPAAPQSR
jgi:cytosine/adenosine deaminase-related metal-dependent hydrolase